MNFVEKQLKLLLVEREAEKERAEAGVAVAAGSSGSKGFPTGFQELERKGLALRRLSILETKVGLCGSSVIVVFGRASCGRKKNEEPELPSTTISSGDIVGVYQSNASGSSEKVASGVVTSALAKSVSVSFDDKDDDDDVMTLRNGSETGSFNLIKLANDVTYKRLKRAMERVGEARGFGLLHNALLDSTTSFSPPHQSLPPNLLDEIGDLKFCNGGLNACQRGAVEFALKQRELAIIHGPPGTGKTTTVVEYIRQELAAGRKLLCCAPSNVAVDNLLEKLAQDQGNQSGAKRRLVRLGHPARVQGSLQKHSLDSLVSASDQTQLAEDVRKDIGKVLSGLGSFSKDQKGQKGHRKVKGPSFAQLKKELKDLKKELYERERRAIKEILKGANVVLSTLTSAASWDGPLKHLEDNHFDVVVIDECSQSLEMACWIALLHAKKAVLSGDHMQLPPTIMSPEAAKGGLSLTLMERMIGQDKNGDLVRMLKVQYRMNEKIMGWSSATFYQGKLEADPSVSSRLLSDLPCISGDGDIAEVPLMMIDTAGCDMPELVAVADEASKANEGEASLVVAHVDSLVEMGLNPREIAVITPYNLQVDLIRAQLAGKYQGSLEVRSVDGFQGREKEAVVISLVRSNQRREVGFLSESRRLNVAVTRAKRHLALICDSETVGSNPAIKHLIQHIEAHGEVRAASQYQDRLDSVVKIHRPDGLQLSEATTSTKATATREKLATKTEEKVKDDARRAKELEATIRKFLEDSDRQILRFPASLNSYDRMLVHDISEKLGLFHQSQGEAKDRHILVSKTSPEADQVTPEQAAEPEAEPEAGPEAEPEAVPLDSEDSEGQELSRRRTYLETVIAKFLEGDDARLEFPADLSSHDRLVVHEVAEALGLNHQSEGDGRKRHVVVSKKGQADEEAPKAGSARVLGKGGHLSTCHGCLKEMPKGNLDLHLLRCPSVKAEKPKETKAKAKAKKVKAAAKTVDDEDDLDSLLQGFKKLDTVCNYNGPVSCKASVALLGQTCKFCRGRFCFAHGIPEVHGCGDLAKKAARQAISSDQKLYSGSGRPSFLPDPTKKAILQRRLDKTLKEKKDERSRKVNSSNK